MEETVKKVQVSFDPPPPKKEKTVQTQKEKQNGKTIIIFCK